jgi:8-oxo-dGTP diphosphatase
MRTQIQDLIQSIKPYDNLEKEHIEDALHWIKSGVEIFRIQKPDVPPKHLVSYFVVVDQKRRKILLMDHIKAGLWLPSGGHVEKDEHPRATVEREVQEELNFVADFVFDIPLFITQTVTVNLAAGHIDVSLWYVLVGDSAKEINYDPREFNGYKWFDYEEILEGDIKKFDPHMHRFTKKFLSTKLAI